MGNRLKLVLWIKNFLISGVGGPRVNGKLREVTRAELRKHRTRRDAWEVLEHNWDGITNQHIEIREDNGWYNVSLYR